jgi:spore germination protein YaaH
MGFTYTPDPMMPTSSPEISRAWNFIAAAAAAETTAFNTNKTYRMLTWSDASAIEEKIKLARKLGVRGVSVFKIDGGEDPRMWEVLK